MKWKPLLLTTALGVWAGALPAAAEPVVLAKNATELSYSVQNSTIDVVLPSVAGAGTVFLQFGGFAPNDNYFVQAYLTNTSGQSWSMVEAEILNQASAKDDANDPPSTLAANNLTSGFSPSNEVDGISFSQDSGLNRSSDVFADVFADERTNVRDFLRYSGGVAPTGTQTLLTFGLRDYDGNRTFLLALTPTLAGASTPEPATLLLMGTGGLGVIRAIRKRRRARA